MITIEEAGEMLDEIAETIPKEIYRDLNGGILLFPEEKPHPKSREDDFFILGEYRHEHDLGRYIVIFYGSFVRVYGHLPPEAAKEKLRKILFHEFTHHLESLAGEHDLEITDAIELAEYERRHARRVKRLNTVGRIRKNLL